MFAKHHLFDLAFTALALSGVDRALGPWTRGRGAILTAHHVRPWTGKAFAPNRLLEIGPDFLEQAIIRARQAGFVFVPLEEAPDRVKSERGPPFLCLTFDDGYRDNLEHALPVLVRHGVPATVFLTPGFIDRTAPLWWRDLEEAIRRADVLEVDWGEGVRTLPCSDDAARTRAFQTLYAALRAGPEQKLRDVIGRLAETHGVDSAGLADQQCLDWQGVAELASHPLITAGAHTMTHPMLAHYDEATVRRELDESRSVLSRRLQRVVRHVAYPVGDSASAGAREFAIARDLGFQIGVTTRPGMLFPTHATQLLALPRLSLNGYFQSARQFESLLTGVPSLLWNKGKRVAVV